MDNKMRVMIDRKASDGLDYYPTPKWAVRALLENHGIAGSKRILDPCAGQGYILSVLKEYGYECEGGDIKIYNDLLPDVSGLIREQNFLTRTDFEGIDYIITNFPYANQLEFVLHALKNAYWGVCIFTRLQWLEGKERYNRLFSVKKPDRILLFSERVNIHEGISLPENNSAVAFCWVIWDMMVGNTQTAFKWIEPCKEKLERGGVDYPHSENQKGQKDSDMFGN